MNYGVNGVVYELNVHVLDRHVGVLEQVGDFRSIMAYTRMQRQRILSR